MTQIDQKLIQQLPIGLLSLDGDGRIAWANNTLMGILEMDSADLVGRPIPELPQAAQDLLSTEPKLYQVAASQRWISRDLQSGEDGQQLLILADVSSQEQLAEENVRLRQRVEDLKLTDDLTGLPNKRAISQALDLHISRSRRYENPLSIVLAHVDMHALSGVHALSTEPAVLAVSRFLRDRLRWVDQIARWDSNVFLLVLPETTEEDARNLLQKIGDEQDSMVIPESYGDLRPQLAFGLACWQKGDDMRTLMRNALNTLREEVGA